MGFTNKDIFLKCRVMDPGVVTVVKYREQAYFFLDQCHVAARHLGLKASRAQGFDMITFDARLIPEYAKTLTLVGLTLACFERVVNPRGHDWYERRHCYDFSALEEAHRIAFDDALAELRAGQPDTGWSRWMFPCLRDCAMSAARAKYALASEREAADLLLYHPFLGKNIKNAVRALTGKGAPPASTIFPAGSLSWVHASIELFAKVAPPETRCFATALCCTKAK